MINILVCIPIFILLVVICLLLIESRNIDDKHTIICSDFIVQNKDNTYFYIKSKIIKKSKSKTIREFLVKTKDFILGNFDVEFSINHSNSQYVEIIPSKDKFTEKIRIEFVDYKHTTYHKKTYKISRRFGINSELKKIHNELKNICQSLDIVKHENSLLKDMFEKTIVYIQGLIDQENEKRISINQ